MATPANSTQRDVINQLQVDVGIIKSQMGEFKVLQQSMSNKMDGFAFVKQSDYEDFKKEVRETYATKEEVKPMKTLFWAIVTASAVAIVGILAGKFMR